MIFRVSSEQRLFLFNSTCNCQMDAFTRTLLVVALLLLNRTQRKVQRTHLFQAKRDSRSQRHNFLCRESLARFVFCSSLSKILTLALVALLVETPEKRKKSTNYQKHSKFNSAEKLLWRNRHTPEPMPASWFHFPFPLSFLVFSLLRISRDVSCVVHLCVSVSRSRRLMSVHKIPVFGLLIVVYFPRICFFRQSDWLKQDFQGHLKVFITLKFCLVLPKGIYYPQKSIFNQSEHRKNSFPKWPPKQRIFPHTGHFC